MHTRTPFQILCQNRGWNQRELDHINTATTERLGNIDTLTTALHEAFLAKTPITILPDFDTDGITSGIIGYAGLSELGFTVNILLPDYRRGHEMQASVIDEALALYPNTGIFLTCDAGINSHDLIARAHETGRKIYVTDHHQELSPCPADIAVDPCRINDPYPEKGICGAVVLWKVLCRYTERFVPMRLAEMERLGLFAGIGTVGDVMPILFENRHIVKKSVALSQLLYPIIPDIPGDLDKDEQDEFLSDYENIPLNTVHDTVLMQILEQEGYHHPAYLTAFRGYALLMLMLELHQKVPTITDITEELYGFTLAPLFNSPRRIDVPQIDSSKVFFLDDERAQFLAAKECIEINNRRKELVTEVYEKLIASHQPHAPYIYVVPDNLNLPSGCYGLVANMLLSDNGMPTLVVDERDGVLGGSARSPWYVPLLTISAGAPSFHAVGHENACGVQITPENGQSLADVLAQTADLLRHEEAARRPADTTQESTADLAIHFAQTGDENDEESYFVADQEELVQLAIGINALAPFGKDFPKPVIACTINLSECRISEIGSEKQHMRIRTPQGFTLLWWNAAERFGELTSGHSTSLIADVTLSLNTFMGKTSPQGIIQGIH